MAQVQTGYQERHNPNSAKRSIRLVVQGRDGEDLERLKAELVEAVGALLDQKFGGRRLPDGASRVSAHFETDGI